MTTAAMVLLAVAKELVKQAKSSLPKIREGEEIQREWYINGIYYRETSLNGEITVHLYDFRQRKSRLLAAGAAD